MIFGNRLLFKGCMYNFFLKDLFEKYRKLLQQHIDFIVIPKENCCGSPLKNLGYFEEFEELVGKNMELFKEYSVKEIICLCPACYYTLKYEYSKVLGNKWKIKVKHVTEVLWELIEKGKIKPKELNFKATYHDPCHLGRHSRIFDIPRRIIRSFGIELKEMELSKEISFCCGGGGGLKANFPEVSKKIAEKRIVQALETNSKYLITTCPMCYSNLKEVADGKIIILEIVELFYL